MKLMEWEQQENFQERCVHEIVSREVHIQVVSITALLDVETGVTRSTLTKMFPLWFLLIGRLGPVDGAAQGLVDGQLSKPSVIPGLSRLVSSRDSLPEDMSLSEWGPGARQVRSFRTSLIELCRTEMNTVPQEVAVIEKLSRQMVTVEVPVITVIMVLVEIVETVEVPIITEIAVIVEVPATVGVPVTMEVVEVMAAAEVPVIVIIVQIM